MKLIIGSRAAGKTHQLVEWLLQGHKVDNAFKWSRIILAPHAGARSAAVHEIANIVASADEYGYTDEFLSTLPNYPDLVITPFGYDLNGIDVEIGIDNVDILLSALLVKHMGLTPGVVNIHPIKVMTLTHREGFHAIPQPRSGSSIPGELITIDGESISIQRLS
jgi:hypothetical protein